MKQSEQLKEFRDDPSKLAEKEKELRHELMNLRFRKTSGQLTNASRIGDIRRNIARIATVRRQQQNG